LIFFDCFSLLINAVGRSSRDPSNEAGKIKIRVGWRPAEATTGAALLRFAQTVEGQIEQEKRSDQQTDNDGSRDNVP